MHVAINCSLRSRYLSKGKPLFTTQTKNHHKTHQKPQYMKRKFNWSSRATLTCETRLGRSATIRPHSQTLRDMLRPQFGTIQDMADCDLRRIGWRRRMLQCGHAIAAGFVAIEWVSKFPRDFRYIQACFLLYNHCFCLVISWLKQTRRWGLLLRDGRGANGRAPTKTSIIGWISGWTETSTIRYVCYVSRCHW